MAVLDQNGTVLPSTFTVGLSVFTGAASGVILSGPTSVLTTTGVAQFTGLSALSFATADRTIQLQVTIAGFSNLTGLSAPFTIYGTGPPAKFSVILAPTYRAHQLWGSTQALTVVLQDSKNRTIRASGYSVNIMLVQSSQLQIPLNGVLSRSFLNGTAVFADLSIDVPHSALTILVAGFGQTSVLNFTLTTPQFRVLPGALIAVRVPTVPTFFGGSPVGNFPVELLDALSGQVNFVTDVTVVTLSLLQHPGALLGNTTMITTSGR